MRIIRGLVLRLLFGVLAASLPLQVLSQPSMLRLAHTLPSDSPLDRAARQLAAEVERGTSGRVKIQVFPDSQLLKPVQLVEALRLGVVDFALVSTPLIARSVPDFEVFELPFLFEDYGAARRFESSASGIRLLQGLEASHIKGFAYWHGPMKVIAGRKPLVDPTDLKGVKLVSFGSKTRNIVAFERLGAKVSPMAFAEVYVALQNGVVDAAESSIPAIEQRRLFEVEKYLNVTNHAYVGYVLAAGKKRWEMLSSQDRSIVEKIVERMTPEANALVVNQLSDTIKSLAGRIEFKTLSGPQREVWRRSVEPTWKEFANNSQRQEMVRVALASGTGGGGDPCPIDECRCENRTCSKQCCSK